MITGIVLIVLGYGYVFGYWLITKEDVNILLCIGCLEIIMVVGVGCLVVAYLDKRKKNK